MNTEPNNTKAITFQRPADLMRFLESGKGAIAAALPKHLNSDRMLRLAVTQFSTNPALRECTGLSILSSIVVASQLGLEPGIAGQGYLIPYKGVCTFVPGWQGMVQLLNNTGRATAWTGIVFEGDEFQFELGSKPILRHVPGDNYGDSEKMLWAYACGKVNGSEQPVIECWPMSRVWKHRDKNNKVGSAHYSFRHPEMYARKVVLLQVLKYMPRSIELNNAIVASDAVEMGRTVQVVEGVIQPEPGDVEAEAELQRPKFDEKPPEEKTPATKRPRVSNTKPISGGNLFPGGEQTSPAQAIRNLAKGSRTTEAQVLAFINKSREPEFQLTSLDNAPEGTLNDLRDNWVDLLSQINPDVAP